METDKAGMPQVAGYRTEAILGEGGMATVYLAVQESLSRHVALKVMNQLLVIDEDFRRRFLNEGRLIAKLSHPNIVTVYDIGVSGNIHYLSMTYLPGGSLKDRIREGQSLGQSLDILKRLADALGYAHRHGIVHRDIKPGNVLFTDGGAPVLTDFGIAKTVGSETQLTSTGMTVGSARYMSPEQALGLVVDNRSDLYSLGVLFWQMLTGGFPYHAEDPFALALKHANDPIPDLPPNLQRFQPLIDGLLAKKPEDRPASAEELARMLDGIPSDDIAATSPLDPDETILLPRAQEWPPGQAGVAPEEAGEPEPARKTRTVALAAALVVLGLVGMLGYLGYQGLFPSPTEAPVVAPPPDTGPAADGEPVAPIIAGAAQEPAKSADLPAAAPPEGQTEQGERVPTRAAADQARAGSAEGAGENERQAIDALLRQAQDHWSAGRLVEPPGSNAFESYSRVLDLDQEHEEAKQRLVQIGRINAASKVFQFAENLLRQGEIDAARRMIETGLRMNPDDERLLGLARALDYEQ